MNVSRMARGIATAIALMILAASASSLFAADPIGDTPSNGLAVTCQVETIATSGKLWFKIPYRKGSELEIDLTAVDGVYFDVFAPDQVKYFPSIGQPLGRSVPDPADPIYQRSWQGQMVQSDFLLDYYYIRVTNTISMEAMYRLCFKEIKSSVIEPTGTSPEDGLTSAPCALQSLDARSQIWHKIPYSSGKEFELYLKTISDEVNFEVFTPEQVKYWYELGQPIGRGSVNRNEPEFAKSWQGHLTYGDYYYVRVTNPGTDRVQYQLCLTAQDLPDPNETSVPIRPTPTRRLH